MSNELDIGLFAEKVGGEVVGGRVMGMVDGVKVYLTDYEAEDGTPYMTEAGILLDSQTENPAPKPSRRARKAAEAPAAEAPAAPEAPAEVPVEAPAAEVAPTSEAGAADDIQIEV